MTKGVLRFFFDYGAGCLWAGDAATLASLGVGPVEDRLLLSQPARDLIDRIGFMHSCCLNPLYPLDPSLWSQSLCDRFNAEVDSLIGLLRQEIGDHYDILDQQERHVEDARLSAYLLAHPDLERQDEALYPTVR